MGMSDRRAIQRARLPGPDARECGGEDHGARRDRRPDRCVGQRRRERTQARRATPESGNEGGEHPLGLRETDDIGPAREEGGRERVISGEESAPSTLVGRGGFQPGGHKIEEGSRIAGREQFVEPGGDGRDEDGGVAGQPRHGLPPDRHTGGADPAADDGERL